MAAFDRQGPTPWPNGPSPLLGALILAGLSLILGSALLPARAQTPEIRLSGPPPALAIQTAWAGQQPDPVSDGSTTLTYTTGSSGTFRIVAILDAATPAGVSLEVRAGSGSYHLLNTSPVVILAGLPANTTDTVPVTYRLSVTVSAGPVSLAARQVAFLVEGEP